MSFNRSPTWLLAMTLAFCAPGITRGQQPSQAEANAIRQNCRSDYMSLCASVPTGTPASLQCLQQHQAELSPQCRSTVAAAEGARATPPAATAAQPAPPAMTRRQEMALMRRACGADYRALCRGVPLGGGQALGCLAANRAQLSSGCKRALAEMRAAR